ncbi:ExbD/TolR family protein [Paracoccus xiamenensis]|uniref:ExbD/TolR family protein n=1 Tax=Paracoccus xiamenensis TaxID=2714901 RepID=UPI0014072C35|nr:biopolymer transporter ExbD [Paracoccus xiamenensis]NHF73860.1 biopolymer transporter ExbD [Paracoccus xiamenensis]
MAGGQKRPGLVLPRRNRRYRFSMTPLADVMFQLLIFFMLSANIAPYSMLDLRTGGLSGGGGSPDPQSATDPGRTTDIRSTAVWTLDPAGTILASGQRYDPARLPALADALLAQGTRDVLVVLRRDVAVQQLVTVLQTLAARGITSVQIASGGV